MTIVLSPSFYRRFRIGHGPGHTGPSQEVSSSWHPPPTPQVGSLPVAALHPHGRLYTSVPSPVQIPVHLQRQKFEHCKNILLLKIG